MFSCPQQLTMARKYNREFIHNGKVIFIYKNNIILVNSEPVVTNICIININFYEMNFIVIIRKIVKFKNVIL